MSEQAVARIGDTGEGTCSLHPGNRIVTFDSGSSTTKADSVAILRIGDTGVTDCGGVTIATTGSSAVKADDIFVHRVGDVGNILHDDVIRGTYTVTTGSPNFKAA